MAATVFRKMSSLVELDRDDPESQNELGAGYIPVGLRASLTAAASNHKRNPSSPGGGASGGNVEITYNEIEDPTQDTIKEGFLHKVGDVVKSWKTRYFRLTPGRLSYYSSGESTEQRLGSILLPQATLAIFNSDAYPNRPYCIGITPADSERQYILDCDSATERRAWLDALAWPVRQRLRTLPDAMREGWLTKLGAWRRNWKTRYFILTREALAYQSHPTDLKFLGAVPLAAGFNVAADDDEQGVAAVTLGTQQPATPTPNMPSNTPAAAAAEQHARRNSSSTNDDSTATSATAAAAAASGDASSSVESSLLTKGSGAGQSATPYGFVLRPRGGDRVYHFLCNLKQDRDDWVATLLALQQSKAARKP